MLSNWNPNLTSLSTRIVQVQLSMTRGRFEAVLLREGQGMLDDIENLVAVFTFVFCLMCIRQPIPITNCLPPRHLTLPSGCDT